MQKSPKKKKPEPKFYTRVAKLRLNPNKEQEKILRMYGAASGIVWNKMLAIVKEEEKPDFFSVAKNIRKWRFGDDLLSKINYDVLGYVRDHMQKAFYKKGGGNRLKFKQIKGMRDCSFSFRRFDIDKTFKKWKLRLPTSRSAPKFDRWIKFIPHRWFDEGEIKTATITLDTTGKWYVAINFRINRPLPKKKKYNKSNTVGMDFGSKTAITLSDGSKLNPPDTSKYDRKIGQLQKQLSRKTRGSNRRIKLRTRVAKWIKRRSDFISHWTHQVSYDLSKSDYNAFAVEDWGIQRMLVDNKKNKKLPVKVKRAFNRKLKGLCIGDFRNKLAYKSDLAGKTYIKINPKNTSRTCSSCGHLYEDLNIHEREWVCEKCEVKNDRDVNAAQVIKKKAFEK
jgi:putative transposase